MDRWIYGWMKMREKLYEKHHSHAHRSIKDEGSRFQSKVKSFFIIAHPRIIRKQCLLQGRARSYNQLTSFCSFPHNLSKPCPMLLRWLSISGQSYELTPALSGHIRVVKITTEKCAYFEKRK